MTSQIEVRSKFLALKGGLNAQFLERGAVINGLLMALVARQHVLLLGVPGTAKSALGNALCGALKGAEYF
jgi:MoxR-like ATPase